jgi:hypothetical protein
MYVNLPETVELVSSWWFCDVAAPLTLQDSRPLGTEKDISIIRLHINFGTGSKKRDIIISLI